MLNVNQLITWATWTAVGVVVLPVRLPVTLMRTGTVVVTMLLTAIRGHTVAIYMFRSSQISIEVFRECRSADVEMETSQNKKTKSVFC